MRYRTMTVAAAGVVGMSTSVLGGVFFENFDSYDNGASLHGLGGWKGWDNNPDFTAFVSDAQSLSGPHSADVFGSADLVHEFKGATQGQWTFTAWQYVPELFIGQQYFILLNTYSDGGDKNWSTQVQFNSVDDTVVSDFDGATLPLIRAAWVELRVEIDLDADMQTFYYGGDELYTKSWTDGVTGNGALNIGAVDLFANNSGYIYYDDISLVPAPGAFVVLTAAGLGFARRRRRR